MEAEPTVFVIDDDAGVRNSLGFLLRAARLSVKTFASAREFLSTDPTTWKGCIVADIRMPDMDGLELQAELRKRNTHLPVIIITGHGDVPLAVRAMKGGAIDFLEKPVPDERLLSSIRIALKARSEASPQISNDKALQERVNRLTAREREVFTLLAAGKPRKVVAEALGISQRTVDVHRANIMEKLGVNSIGELILLAVDTIRSATST